MLLDGLQPRSAGYGAGRNWNIAAPTSPASNALAHVKRATTNEIIHDSFFIPGVAVSGAMVLIIAVCLFFLLRKRQRPPGVQWATQTRLATDIEPRASMSAQQGGGYGYGPGIPGSPDGSRRLSNLQRKPLPPTIAPGSPPQDTYDPYETTQPFQNQNHNQNQYQPQPQMANLANVPYQAQGQQQSTAYRPETVAFDSLPQAHALDQRQQAPSQGHDVWNTTRPVAGPPATGGAPQPGTRVSFVSSGDQSATQVGSDAGMGSEPAYYPGGYGKVKPAGLGVHAEEADEHFDPYGGIDEGYTGSSRRRR